MKRLPKNDERKTVMQYAHLGRSGLKVSRLCLGMMNFGEITDEPTSLQILNAAVEAGINFVDTADVYGGLQSPGMEKGFGLSEEISKRQGNPIWRG
ncbi:UNVERIFIED_ORG: aryl-alcohol dehydrogenase-like predicted oxidoreductase [Rhizobium sp. SORGH_AS260]|nr:aryl-alcohol dehydrogenase-like predicted oxidoreductase [Rhizobium sp. SORGH_AS_0285]MDP9756980.1 aryl-alcohol dehydrogenase-like predicted oxidoreductase [Rhizobium sp. SORGH_AS_0260]MDR6083771.1 aryl-alcohol dehydrogenase-like predicted oxidoreductase [Agrobacterium sp. SORGH_AS_0440]